MSRHASTHSYLITAFLVMQAAIGYSESVRAGEPAEGAGPPQAAAASEPAPRPSDEAAAGTHGHLERAADFAPVGVTLDHTHRKGDWTFSYHYVRDQRSGLMSGTGDVTVASVQSRYSAVPLESEDDVHAIGAMYAPHDRLTFSLVLPYMERELSWLRGGVNETLTSKGIGDARLMFLVPFMQKPHEGGNEKTHVTFGISFPTGSIRETRPGPSGGRLPYVMQLGSGSWDLHFGLTYTGHHRFLSWGSQFESLYRLHDNDLGYRLGTVYDASLWLAGSVGRWFAASFRLAWHKQGNVRGEDPTFDKTESALFDNKRQGESRLEIGPGINILLPFLGRQRLAMEASWPVWEDVDGPQLAQEVTFTLGWQAIF